MDPSPGQSLPQWVLTTLAGIYAAVFGSAFYYLNERINRAEEVIGTNASVAGTNLHQSIEALRREMREDRQATEEWRNGVTGLLASIAARQERVPDGRR